MKLWGIKTLKKFLLVLICFSSIFIFTPKNSIAETVRARGTASVTIINRNEYTKYENSATDTNYIGELYKVAIINY
jgi:hypothetical protein